MGAIDYHPRDENEMTAQAFQWCAYDDNWNLVAEVLHHKRGTDNPHATNVQGRLHAFPFRDYFDQKAQEEPGNKGNARKRIKQEAKPVIAELYADYFPSLHEDIEKFSEYRRDLGLPPFANIKETQYNSKYPKELFENIYGTELDVLMEDDCYAYIGESKNESKLNGDGNRNLVHQLPRQYVTYTLWNAYERVVLGKTSDLQIVPFVVAPHKKLAHLENEVQIAFMLHQEWFTKTTSPSDTHPWSVSEFISYEELEDLRTGNAQRLNEPILLI